MRFKRKEIISVGCCSCIISDLISCARQEGLDFDDLPRRREGRLHQTPHEGVDQSCWDAAAPFHLIQDLNTAANGASVRVQQSNRTELMSLAFSLNFLFSARFHHYTASLILSIHLLFCVPLSLSQYSNTGTLERKIGGRKRVSCNIYYFKTPL